jgi:hypothetical protein
MPFRKPLRFVSSPTRAPAVGRARPAKAGLVPVPFKDWPNLTPDVRAAMKFLAREIRRAQKES